MSIFAQRENDSPFWLAMGLGWSIIISSIVTMLMSTVVLWWPFLVTMGVTLILGLGYFLFRKWRNQRTYWFFILGTLIGSWWTFLVGWALAATI